MSQNKILVFMNIAEQIAKRSHDAETQVGAVLVKSNTNAIIATGYNGFIRNAADDKLPNTRPKKYNYIVHAEMNLIANCARHGISTDETYLVCTHSPCQTCIRMLYNCGINTIICKHLYKDFNDIVNMRDMNIAVTNNDLGFYILHLEANKNPVIE